MPSSGVYSNVYIYLKIRQIMKGSNGAWLMLLGGTVSVERLECLWLRWALASNLLPPDSPELSPGTLYCLLLLSSPLEFKAHRCDVVRLEYMGSRLYDWRAYHDSHDPCSSLSLLGFIMTTTTTMMMIMIMSFLFLGPRSGVNVIFFLLL